MAKSLNLLIVAEGVETIEQNQFLISKGCSRFQGYLFGRPLSIDEFNYNLVINLKALRQQELLVA